MKPFWIAVVFMGASIALTPQSGFSQTTTTADAKDQPKVNFFNPSRQYSRPVLGFFQDIGFRVNFDFLSRYVWNGLAYSRGPVWQPSAAIEYKGFGVNVSGNFVLNDEPNQGQFNEVDFTGYYGILVRKFDIDVSVTYSIYPNDDPASLNSGPNCMNGNLHLAYPLGPLNLFSDLSIWFINPGGGLFWDFGLGYQRNLPLNFSLSTSLLFGLSNDLYNRQFIANIGTGANLFNYSLSFPWSPAKGLIITPEFNVSTLLRASLRAAQPFPTNVWVDLDIGYNF